MTNYKNQWVLNKYKKMELSIISVASFLLVLRCPIIELVHGQPIQNTLTIADFDRDYTALKHTLIYNWGYSEDFADAVEINLKRAISEEIERQRQLGVVILDQLRQNVPDDYYEDESTLPPAPTTPGASPTDVVRGVAGIFTSLGTFNLMNFWQSFVNFFPPSQRESAQALVDASLGRRPLKWPTIPTTTTKLTTTTKDEDEIDSEETTKASVTTSTTLVSATTQQTVSVTSAPVASVTQGLATVVAPATVAASRLPATRYTVRRRPVDEDVLGNVALTNSQERLLQKDATTTTIKPTSTPANLKSLNK